VINDDLYNYIILGLASFVLILTVISFIRIYCLPSTTKEYKDQTERIIKSLNRKYKAKK